MYSVEQIKKILVNSDHKKTIVLPEGEEPKIQEVANTLVKENISKVIMLFQKTESIPTTLDSKIEVIAIDELDKEPLIQKFMDLRKDKTNFEQATKLMGQANYIGAMLVKMEKADCMLCGITYTTADTIRPALQIIKTSPNVALAASVFIMNKGEENYFFTDCALNLKPTSQQLADISKMTAKFAQSFDVKNPEVALLSYSTAGSGAGEDVVRVKEAVELLDSQTVDFNYAGEIQFDAAWDKEIRDKKFKDCKLTKQTPDVFVFPDINAGNIGYKIAQRMGGYEAIGPFILGFNKPVNDLSRGATLTDIMNTAIITIYQALEA
ncbi:phosphate acetyltransferase [Mesoplasma coleopterae]|uniref:Phosphate acetyltransferase n=1 Tax=Mesoplasma coleopterae TaxID=324078 RepID=A0A2K8P1G0_9MOLU|nr:phosphate acetyltransferase [Mesoplasma coleopterae]ATZ20569.1 phosphotransacetylase [Mesoplasma coleopterae]AVN62090.1 phosphate acetyltransferase [Mesoplasma coleopterae]